MSEAALPLEAPAPAQESQPSDPPAPSREAIAKREAEVDARRKAILESARQKLKAEFRAAQGLPAPARETEQQASPSATETVPQAVEQVPVAEQRAPVADPKAIAEAFTAQLSAQYQAAEQAKAEAARVAQEAQKRAQEAEAKLQAFLNNPAAYMQETGLDLDKWNARLLNGGEPTPEEKLMAAVKAELASIRKEVLEPVTQVKQELHAEKRVKALTELTPVLAKDFPLVNKAFGPEAVLDELQRQTKLAGRPVDAGQVLAQLENSLIAQRKAELQDQAVVAKLGLSVQSPPAEVAAQSPRTLTNRVTSTVNPTPARPTSDADRIARGRELIRKLVAAGQL